MGKQGFTFSKMVGIIFYALGGFSFFKTPYLSPPSCYSNLLPLLLLD